MTCSGENDIFDPKKSFKTEIKVLEYCFKKTKCCQMEMGVIVVKSV